MASKLYEYLLRMATSAEARNAHHDDPDGSMIKAGLSAEERAAMKSRKASAVKKLIAAHNPGVSVAMSPNWGDDMYAVRFDYAIEPRPGRGAAKKTGTRRKKTTPGARKKKKR